MKAAARFRVDGRQPELWDAVTGQTRKLPEFTAGNGRTQVPLEFAPRQSLLVVFRQPLATADAAGPRERGTNFPILTRVGEVSGPWQVHFDPKWHGPDAIQFDKLVDWTQRPEEDIRHYSGTAIYKKTFDVPAPAAPGRKMYLDLGTVHSMARVKLNGRDLGLVWCAPWQVEITGAVKETGNALEIEVVNVWANRIIGDQGLPPEKRVTAETTPVLKAGSPLVPSGLAGPVTLLAR